MRFPGVFLTPENLIYELVQKACMHDVTFTNFKNSLTVRLGREFVF